MERILATQRKCIRRGGNESLTRVTQETARMKSLKGNVQPSLLFTVGKHGPRIQTYAVGEKKLETRIQSEREEYLRLGYILHQA